jgi:proteasome lid subunit RPN8/RPN11
VHGEPSIIMRGEALEIIEHHMDRDSSVSVGGVLVGNASPNANLVIVTGSVPLDRARTDSFAADTTLMEALIREATAQHPGQRVVGWYRTHPGEGVFLTAADRFLHAQLFQKPWHVVYVVDTASNERGFFGTSGGDLVRVPRWEVTAVSVGATLHLPVAAPEDDVDGSAGSDQDLAAIDADGGASGDDASGPDGGHALRDSTGGHAIVEPTWGDQSAETERYPSDVEPMIGDPADGALAGEPVAVTGGGGDSRGRAPGSGTVIEATADGQAMPVAPTKRRPVAGLLIVLGLVLVAVVIYAIASGDDDGNDSLGETDPTSVATSPSGVEATAPFTVGSDDIASETTTASSIGEAPTATEGAAPEPGAVTAIPTTPTVVTPPPDRIAAGATRCEQTAEGTYSPLSDCFVPLVNGNILRFTAGSLRCAEPSDRVVANEAQTFTVGVEGDPLAILADDALVPKCSELDYAKNVMAGGASTLDRLCGSSGTQINEATTRCFAMNPATGSMAAVLRDAAQQDQLAGACYSAANPDPVPLAFTTDGVSTAWVIDGVDVDDAGTSTVSVSRNGVTATATYTCA